MDPRGTKGPIAGAKRNSGTCEWFELGKTTLGEPGGSTTVGWAVATVGPLALSVCQSSIRAAQSLMALGWRRKFSSGSRGSRLPVGASGSLSLQTLSSMRTEALPVPSWNGWDSTAAEVLVDSGTSPTPSESVSKQVTLRFSLANSGCGRGDGGVLAKPVLSPNRSRGPKRNRNSA
jgi:hypothetical protein